MVVHHNRLKSWSQLTAEEVDTSLAEVINSFSSDEMALFNKLLSDSKAASVISSFEYDEVPVPIDHWLSSSYYMGEAIRNLYDEWRNDLIELFSSGQYYVAFVTGGLGCIHESTRINTIDGVKKCADILTPTQYRSWNGRQFEYCLGTAPFPKGKGDLYRVIHEQGEFVAFGEHLMLCSDHKYRSVLQQIDQRSLLLSPNKTFESSQSLFPTSQAFFQSVLSLSVQHWNHALLNYQGDCLECSCLYGEQLLRGVGIDLECFPLLNDALASSRVRRMNSCIAHKDDFSEPEHKYNHPMIHFFRLSMSDFSLLMPVLSDLLEADIFGCISQRLMSFGLQFQQFLESCEYHQPIHAPFVSLLQLNCICSCDDLLRFFSSLFPEYLAEKGIFEQYRHLFLGYLLLSFETVLKDIGLRSDRLHHPQFLPSQSPRASEIISIEKYGRDWYWDLQVPGTHNYVAEGAIHHNSGKSEFASIAILRMVYEASCLKNPALSYGLNPGSKIDFGIFAPSEHVAKNAAFDKILSKIRLSPYFLERFRCLNRISDQRAFKQNALNFPKDINIVCGSSTNTAALGGNLMGAFVDELNFFQKTPRGRTASDSRWGESEKAGKLFDGLMRRMKSRFMRRGKLPGVLIGASSKDLHDSLIQRMIRNAAAANDQRVFVRDRSILELKANQFGDKKFKVLLPSEHYRARILDGTERLDEYEDPIVLDIPDEFRADFEQDLEGSLRDIAGVSTFAISNFISHTEKIEQMKDESRSHPFMCPMVSPPRWWDSVNSFQMNWPSLAVQLDNGEWEPRLNPQAKRFIHLDPAISGDAFGFCMGHIAGLREVVTQDMTEYQPIFVVDFILKIIGSREQNIIFRNVRKMIYDFTFHGFSISCISMDTFQSLEMRQFLSQQNYRTEIVSVDESKEPYRYLRAALYENRISCYPYPELYDELRTLEDTPQKIDHPSSGCFVGSTRIPLLDGTIPMISELVGKEVWVYSSTPEGTMVPGKARGRYTKHVDELVDVILDSGAVVRCTPEHLWMMRDGSYQQAKDLIPGIDRLMPITWTGVNGGYIDLNSLILAKSHPDIENANAAARFLNCGRNVVIRVLRENGFSSWEEFVSGLNHKVRLVIPVKLEIPVPVYDLEVDQWSNFALSAGVFVHNSKDLADSLCGMLFKAGQEAIHMTSLPIVRGISQFEKPEQEVFDEQIRDDPIHQNIPSVCQYKKKPKTLQPAYNKITNDGKVIDMRSQREMSVSDFIEVG